MTVAKLNNLDVLEACLTRPRFGRAVLEVTLADSLQNTKLEQGGPAKFDLAGTAGVFAGEVVRLGRVGGTTRVRALEASKLDVIVSPKFYRNADANLIASDILRECGVLTNDLQLGAVFTTYTRKASTGMTALNDLCKQLGANWRSTPTGILAYREIPVSREPRPRANPLVWGDNLLKFDPETLEYTCLVRPGLVPGMIVSANPYGEARDVLIDWVMHSVAGGVVRTCIWAAQ